MYQARLRKRAEILAGNGANGLLRSGGGGPDGLWTLASRTSLGLPVLVALVNHVMQRLLLPS
uniref:Uncharacterized protein n=1 Tax=Anopheles albimanus TaxID=7167 RepID=A0A182F7C2_ANOAL